MSLLLDALKEAEARKREAGVAATAVPARGDAHAPSFEIEGSLALAEDVIPGPEADGVANGAAPPAVRPAASATPATNTNAAAAALLAARAARSPPGATAVPAAPAEAVATGIAAPTSAPAAKSRNAAKSVATGPAATTSAAPAATAAGDANLRGAAAAPPPGAARRAALPWLIAAGVLLAALLGGLFVMDSGSEMRIGPAMAPAAATPAPPAAAAGVAPLISAAPGDRQSGPLATSSAAISTGPPPAREMERSESGRDAVQRVAAARVGEPSSPAQSASRTRAAAQARDAQRADDAGSAGSPRIEISREVAPLQAAWTALQSGDVGRAETLYRRVLEAEPGQVDAQLALAVIAQSRGDDEAARRGYRRVLESVPDHPRAWGGLAELAGEGEAGAVESRLRQLLAAQASAPLHFALGNLLARQQRWDDAQVEYFAAASLAPQAPDYAFNVAVALERIGKGNAALTWYNRSLELAAGGRAARFDAAAVRARVGQLQAAAP